MKATGIVRRIDDLGRIVIPKEIRRTMRIREGDPLEIFTDREGEVILKKYSPINELGEFATEYSESLFESIGFDCIITDRDTTIAASGASKKDYLNKRISSDLEAIIETKKTYNSFKSHKVIRVSVEEVDVDEYASQVIVPIISQGDSIGAVILMSREKEGKIDKLEIKVTEIAANFLAKQMEN